MKKIALVLTLAMLLGLGVANAEIRHGIDNFDGSKWITSGTSIEVNHEWIDFQKKVSNQDKEYFIVFSLKTFRDIKFSKENAELKIDENPVKKMSISAVSSSMSAANPEYAYIDTRIILPTEIIQEISTAKHVAIRFFKENSVPDTIVLPSAALAEWKEVIAMEK